MAHINPIKSKPLSPEGRDNYDRIFRKVMPLDDKWLDLQGDFAAQAFDDKRCDKAREAYQELAEKHQDESA